MRGKPLPPEPPAPAQPATTKGLSPHKAAQDLAPGVGQEEGCGEEAGRDGDAQHPVRQQAADLLGGGMLVVCGVV